MEEDVGKQSRGEKKDFDFVVLDLKRKDSLLVGEFTIMCD